MVERKKALELHSRNPGKISVEASVEIDSMDDLDLVYTPGVAEPCKEIAAEREKVYEYTSRGNMVAVVSDGSAVLGLGDIGPEASMPVMEGKCNLMKKFGEVDGFPIVLDSDHHEKIVETVERMAPGFGAINLEDIKAPRCFRVEEELKKRLDIPVFHDDQHGTAIVVSAALKNALELAGKELSDARIVVVGVGAAGYATIEFLQAAGAENIVPVDRNGILEPGNEDNQYKEKIARTTLARHEEGDLEDAMVDADAVIGLSAPDVISREMVESMEDRAIVFALANPTPEIMPEEAKEAGAFIVGTGRSDFDNQVNNSLAFPGVFRGALDVNATEINEEMKIAASDAIAEFIEPETDNVVPSTVDKELAMLIAEEVAEAARQTGVARKT